MVRAASPAMVRYLLWYLCVVLWAGCARPEGLLLLYRPRDVSAECAASHHLRYDLSFGMGMSDTITLVFHTLNDFDYGCEVEITTESSELFLLVVIRYPNSIAGNCAANRDAFVVLKRRRCLRLCDLAGGRDLLSHYYILTLREKIRFRFVSNSSVNADMNANLYQMSVTAARSAPPAGCRGNETGCSIDGGDYCFTSGVVCDGVNNCGLADWFDERRAQCGLPAERLGAAPVAALLCALLCALLMAGRALRRCLPPPAASFFIFNANEDNRLCIATVHIPPTCIDIPAESIRKYSIIPVFSDTSCESKEQNVVVGVGVQPSSSKVVTIDEDATTSAKLEERKSSRRKVTLITSVRTSLQRRMRSLARHDTRDTRDTSGQIL
ncbi:hypothetical protein RR48_15463 [Papilio machaon]|uniref:CUB domain-containing protein n=1 Tax=Papilio machaon TaxID=76193 RepID=A0A194QV27_PAPMA|nr:hypothetical protein RR48_15463 [Papilio machaon]